MRSLVGLVLLVQASISRAAPYYGKSLGEFTNTNHAVSGTVRVADSQTIVIEDFYYDGDAPDAFIWIGTSGGPDSSGTIVPVTPGIEEKLEAYDGQRLILRLPGTKTVEEYTWISVWCRRFGANFGHVLIPSSFNNPAPADLGALPTFAHAVKADSVRVLDAKTIVFENLDYDGNGPDAYFWGDSVSPQTIDGIKLIWKEGMSNSGTNQRIRESFSGRTITVYMPGDTTVYDFGSFGMWCDLASQDFGSIAYDTTTLSVPAVLPQQPPPPTFPNCKVLVEDKFQVKWRVEDSSIKVELAGRVTPGNYLAFGLSGADDRTLMDGSDVTVVWVGKDDMRPNAVDYNLQSKAQCSINDGNGACPDDIPSVQGTEDVTIGDFTSGNGITRISYSRPLNSGDPKDKVIPLDSEVYISWAIGPINPDGRAAKHSSAPAPGDNPQINFGSDSSTCPAFTDTPVGGTKLPPWPATSIEGETTFRAEIGQSGGDRGYTGITGKIGWGIAWYLNGILIPEITVRRGVTYTFEVYGGNNPQNAAEYHPFYITDDSEGGFVQKTQQQQQLVRIFAGPTEGPYCSWEVKEVGDSPDNYDNFDAYSKTLQRQCEGSSTNGGKLTWIPDERTPDVVYYQCYTHRFLGWKIYVIDSSASGVKVSLTLLLAMLGVVTLF